MTRKNLLALALGLVCGVYLIPLPVPAQTSSGTLHQSLPQNWIQQVVQKPTPEKRIQALYSFIETYQLGGRLFPGSSLEPLLKDSSPQVRSLALSLMTPYDASSPPLIIAALDDSDESVLLQAIELLASIKGNESAPYLFRFLGNGPPKVEAAAVSVIGRFKHPEGIHRLIKGLIHYGADVLTPALLMPSQITLNDDRYTAYFRALREYPAQELLPLLRPSLVATDPGVKIMAFKILYYLQVPEVEAPLLAWMRSVPDNLKEAILSFVLVRHSEGGDGPRPTKNPDILAEIFSWAMKTDDNPLQQTAWRYLERSFRSSNKVNEKILEPYLKNTETQKLVINLLPYGFATNYPNLYPYFFQSLASADNQVKLQIIHALNGLRSAEFDAHLTRLIQTHPNPEITIAALYALSEEPRNQDMMKTFLQNPNATVRSAALDIMSRYNPRQSQPQRETLLKLFQQDADQNVRIRAFGKLCQLKEESLIPELVAQVISKDAEHAGEYIKSIKDFCPQRPEFLYPFLTLGPSNQQSVVDALLDWRAGQSAGRLALLLNQADRRLQDQILNFIRITEPDAEGIKQYVLPLLSSSDPQIQANALAAWSALKDLDSSERRAAIPLSSLNSAHQDTRVAALSLLTMEHGVATDLELFTRHVLKETKQPYDFASLIERLNFAQEPQALLPLLDHQEQRIRDSIIGWLKMHAGHELLSELQSRLPMFSPDGLAGALEVIGAIGMSEQVAVIKPFLDHAEPSVRQAAILALGELRVPETGRLAIPLLDGFNPQSQLTAVRTLQALRTPDAVPGLLKALSSPLEDIRREALLALRKIDAREALPDIMQLFSKQSLEDQQFGCFGFPQRSWAIQALSNLVNEESLASFINNIKPEDLYYSLYDAYHTDYSFNRVTVADMLAEQALPQNLLPFLNDPRPLVRRAIAASLANYPDPQWIPALQTQLNMEKDPQVKLALQLSLGLIGDRQVIKSLTEAFQHPEFKEKYWEIGFTLVRLQAPDIHAMFKHKLELQPEEYAVWRLLALSADESTLAWFKQMEGSQNPVVRNNANSALQEAQSLMSPQSGQEPERVQTPRADTTFEPRLNRYLTRIETLKGHPDAMLRLAYDFLNPSTFDDRKDFEWRALAVHDVRFKPVLIPLLAEGVNKYHQPYSERNWAMSVLSGLKLSPEDPLLLDLIQSLSSKDSLAIKLFQAKLWYEQGQSVQAIEHLTSLLSDNRMTNYPAYQVKALQWLSDFSAEPNRLEYLNQAEEIITRSFKDIDYQQFEDLPEMLTQLRKGSALLAAQEPYQAQIAYQKSFDELYTHYRQGNILLTPFGALLHAGLAESAMQQNQAKLAQAHLILALEFWQRRDVWGVHRSEYFTEYLPTRHSPKWAYEQLEQLLIASGDSSRLLYFQARFGKPDEMKGYFDQWQVGH